MIDKEIKKLTKDWYEYVSLDSHKDCDCHWYIMQVYSYGSAPYWRAEHYGYVFDGDVIRASSYEKAKEKLVVLIKKAFKQELEWAEMVFKNPTQYDRFQIGQAAWLKKKGYIKEEKNECR